MNFKRISILFLTAGALLLSSCKEKFDKIDYTIAPVGGKFLSIDSSRVEAVSVSSYPKNILIEDFTGAKCGNCPGGHESAKALQNQYPGRVIVVAVHSFDGALGSIARPFDESHYDFRTQYGTQIGKTFTVIQLPTWSIDRKLFPGETSVGISTRNRWTNFFATEYASTSPVQIIPIKTTVDSVLKMSFQVQYAQDVSDSDYVSVFVTESNMTDLQEDVANPEGIDSNYVHNNVLRKAVYPENGLLLGSKIVKGKTFFIQFSTTMDPKWIVNNCKAVIFVHKQTTTNFYVTQAIEVPLRP